MPKYDSRVQIQVRDLPEETLDALVVVLDEIRRGRSRSRAEISKQAGISRAVVSQRVAELVERGLVSEVGTRPSTGGRPPRQLSFEAGAGHFLVADLGATSIDVAVTDLGAEILNHLSEDADIAAGPEAILDRVDALFAEVRSQAAVVGPVWGIGIGVPGPVEFLTGRPTSPPIMPGWDGYPIRERFADRYSAPVWVDNDVNLMALGEWRAGSAQGHANVVFVKIGTGVGAGLISDGLLHRGANGAAGDVGHVQVADNAEIVCRCGNVGCLEAIAGGAALARDADRAAREGRSPVLARILGQFGSLTARDVARSAEHGDPLSVELLQTLGRRIGLTLSGLVNFFNPSLIVIGGGVADSGDLLLAPIRETVYGRSLALATRDLVVRRSSLGRSGGVIGAASMVGDQLFARDQLARWIEAGTPAGRPEIAAAVGSSGDQLPARSRGARPLTAVGPGRPGSGS
jgi:glucokinase-like ROK family protein